MNMAARTKSAPSANTTMPIPADWTFDNPDVASGFDAHVREQLPWYDLATGILAHIARHYIAEGGLVYDIGASTGNFGRSVAPTLEARKAKLVAIESSTDMARKYSGPGELVVKDAAKYDFQEFDLAVCFLVLMFMPVPNRLAFLRRLIEKTKPGGAVVIFDKFEVCGGYKGTMIRRLTLSGKVQNRASAEDIIAKELSLAGVQRPMPPSVLKSANGDPTEIFRFGEFAGYVIERPE